MTDPQRILANIRARVEHARHEDIARMKERYPHVICIRNEHFRRNRSAEIRDWMRDNLSDYEVSNHDYSVIGISCPDEAVALKMVWG